MVLSGRRSRRFGTQAWIAVAVVVTLLVLVVDASIKSRSEAPIRTLSEQAWVGQVLPILEKTNAQGDEINQLRTEAVTLSAETVLPAMKGVATGANQTVAAAQALKPPAALEGPSGLLVICLETRAEGAQTLSAAMNAALTGGAGDPVGQIQKAIAEFQVADQAYSLFLQHMPAVEPALPKSVWLSNPNPYTSAALSTWLQSLSNARSPLPVHDLQVDDVVTDPPAVSMEGSGANALQILPQADTINVETTVGNLGNRTESGIIVTAALNPYAPGYLRSVSIEIPSLDEGQNETVTLPQLKPPLDERVTLTVTVSPGNGQTNVTGTSLSIAFEMPSPNAPPSTTTTSVAPSPGTTVASSSPSSAG